MNGGVDFEGCDEEVRDGILGVPQEVEGIEMTVNFCFPLNFEVGEVRLSTMECFGMRSSSTALDWTSSSGT